MKTKLIQTAVILSILASPVAYAADEHDHSKESKGEHHVHEEHANKGPNGGHVIQSKAGFTIEVTVEKERKARVIFLDKENKSVALDGQSITGIAGERSAPTKLAFAAGKDADANVLIADKPLPAGAHMPVILVIKTAPDAKSVTERFELHLH